MEQKTRVFCQTDAQEFRLRKIYYFKKFFCDLNTVKSMFVWGIEEGIDLKVLKCEIFDRSDFYDFYTKNPCWVSDLRAKI